RPRFVTLLTFHLSGEVSERFKEHAWKACVGEILPWVRIPPSPPSNSHAHRDPPKKRMTCPKCNAPLVPKPVPGALKFPQRLECPVHGWLPERITPIRMR